MDAPTPTAAAALYPGGSTVTRALLGYGVLVVAILVAMFGFDRDIALAFGAMKTSHPGIIGFFKTVTELGESKWYLWPLGVFLLGLGVVLRRRPALRQQWLPRFQGAGFVFANIALSGLTVNALKIIIGRPRPVLLLDSGIFNDFTLFSFASRWWSFPSGHSATALSLALALAVFFPRWRLPLLLFAGTIAASRIVVTAHYLSDTLAGFAIAALVFSGTQILFRRKGWSPYATTQKSGKILPPIPTAH